MIYDVNVFFVQNIKALDWTSNVRSLEVHIIETRFKVDFQLTKHHAYLNIIVFGQ